MGQELRRSTLLQGKVSHFQDVKPFHFKAIKDQTRGVTTRKDADMDDS